MEEGRERNEKGKEWLGDQMKQVGGSLQKVGTGPGPQCKEMKAGLGFAVATEAVLYFMEAVFSSAYLGEWLLSSSPRRKVYRISSTLLTKSERVTFFSSI